MRILIRSFLRKKILHNALMQIYTLLILIPVSIAGCSCESSGNSGSDISPPGAPGSLNASLASNTRVKLTWSDNSRNESGFRIERAPEENGRAGTFREIGIAPANAVSYINSDLDNDSTYYYRVRAYNRYGISDYTSEAGISTPSLYLKAYYVDYSGGDDSAAGTSKDAAWKHAPGDPEASGNADVTLEPGDAVLFRGGVRYKGSITLNASGTALNPVVYKGDSWGDDKAVIEGSETLTGWVKCASAADCGDNENWENIYYAYVPAGIDCTAFTVNLHENDEFLWIAQEPDIADPFYRDDISEYYTLAEGVMQTTSLADAEHFNQSDSDYWDGSSVMLWISPNIVITRDILSFDPADYTITYEDVGSGGVYTDRETYYCIINSIHALDQAGEYYFNPAAEADGSHKLYLWPRNASSLSSGVDISTRNYGINIANNSYVVIEGFQVQKCAGDGLRDCGIGTYTGYNTREEIIVKNNYIRHNSHAGSTGYGGIYLSECNNSLVENNIIEENVLTTGLFITASNNAIARGNIIRRPGHTGMWFFGNTNSQIVYNTVTEVFGTHGNGITCYLSCKNILIGWNTLSEAGAGFTLQASANMYFYRNIVDAKDGGSNVNEWGGSAESIGGGEIVFLNNTLVRNNRNASLNIGSTTGCTYTVKNNIIDGGGGGDRSHNLYTGLSWSQDDSYSWYLADGEIVQTDPLLVFEDPGNADFHLLSGSQAIDAGTVIEDYLPFGLFPDVDFFADMDGNHVPANGTYDIGAYETL